MPRKPTGKAAAATVTAESHPYIDDKGRRYTRGVMSWHPAARRTLGIRPVEAGADHEHNTDTEELAPALNGD